MTLHAASRQIIEVGTLASSMMVGEDKRFELLKTGAVSAGRPKRQGCMLTPAAYGQTPAARHWLSMSRVLRGKLDIGRMPLCDTFCFRKRRVLYYY